MTATTATATAPGTDATPHREVPTRRMSFEASLADVPKHFARDGDLVASHFIATMSSVFPDGEDFFVKSVRHFRDQITDPELKRQVAGFIGQESVHGREHRVLNDKLDELGYRTKRNERVVRRVLALRWRMLPAESNLALTAALEHFTATLAELTLTDEDFRTMPGHQAIIDVFTWHALEEAEHKAVAFDVYRAVGGSERTRIWTMKFVRSAFTFGTLIQVLASLAADRSTYRRGALGRIRTSLRRNPMLDPRVRAQLREYDRVGFHPDDRDTTELVARWRERLFGDDGELNHHLARSAA